MTEAFWQGSFGDDYTDRNAAERLIEANRALLSTGKGDVRFAKDAHEAALRDPAVPPPGKLTEPRLTPPPPEIEP